VLRESLQLSGPDQEQLFALARTRREECFPTHEVEVRSVIEVSNICQQGCNFCNMGIGSSRKRYIISFQELMHLTDFIYSQGRRVLMLQSGESKSESFVKHVCRCVKEIKHRYPDLELILCLGNLKDDQYKRLKEAGAERYLLKFETANPILYRSLKPRDTLENRLSCLDTLQRIGFKLGSGDIIGFPGQTIDDVVDDLFLMGKLNLSMVSCTVFIPGEDSHLREAPIGNVEWAFNMMALMRIMYPNRLMPTTSSLEKARHNGQYTGLMAGANTVTIHDGTPSELKELFPIYSVLRFAPTVDYMKRIVKKAGLNLAKNPLEPVPLRTDLSLETLLN